MLSGGWEWMLLINKNNKFTDFPALNEIKNNKLKKDSNFNIHTADITYHRFIGKY